MIGEPTMVGADNWITVQIGGRPRLPVSVTVTDLKLVVKARSRTGDTIYLQPGRYIISAASPDGDRWSAEDIVELPRQRGATIVLEPGGDTASPHTTRETRERTTAAPATADPTAAPARLPTWSGHWLAAHAFAPRGRTFQFPSIPWHMPSDTIPSDPVAVVSVPDRDVLIELPEGDNFTYFAVPFEGMPARPTLAHVTVVDRVPSVRFDFAAPELDDLLAYLAAGRTLEARRVSSDIIARAEAYMSEKQSLPLLATIGSYVLLRANELDGLDAWNRNLLRVAGDHIPDARVLLVETLARMGQHEQAIALLAETPLRMPWVRSGVAYLEQRLKLYLGLSDPDRSASSGGIELAEDVRSRFATALRGLHRVGWALDMSLPFSTYRGLRRVVPLTTTPVRPAGVAG